MSTSASCALPSAADTTLAVPFDPSDLVGPIRLEELVVPASTVSCTASLEEAHRQLPPNESGYFAVLDGDRPVGLGSRSRIGYLMGSRFGFALFSGLSVTEALVPNALLYCSDDPTEPLLEQALSRSGEEFHEDVILIDADGRYLGLLPTWRLARLQTQLLAAQLRHGREQQAAMHQSNLDLFRKIAALRQSEARYRSLFNNSSTGFALLDPDGNVANANARLLQLLGTPAGEPLCFGAVLPPEQRSLLRPPATSGSPGTPPAQPVEFTLRVPDRGERLVRLYLSWIPETGQWSVALDDITEERALQAQSLQREKRSLLEALVGGVAHELNNKLTPVIGFAALLTTGATAEEAADYGDIIGRSAGEATRIIQQLLHLSKPAQPQREVFELHKLVAETLTLLKFRLRDAGVTVTLPSAADPIELYADPGQLRQVLLNLCVNAIDAMAGRPRRTLTVSAEAEAGRIVLRVADTGTGIGSENLTRIFHPFFTTKGPSAGTGLGLSVCAGIVEQHGGTIAVRNRAEGGAEFTVRLPALAAPSGEPRPGPRPSAGTARLPLPGRMLLVEDEDVVARLVQEIVLRHFDCEVVRAANGAEALALCTGGRFACIVSDLRMPVMNGLDFYEQLRLRDPGLARRFVFMSGYEGDIQYSDRLSATGVPMLPKPFTAPDLVALLRPFGGQS